MDRALLGSRIKEARLAKKLTQTEVVGPLRLKRWPICQRFSTCRWNS